MASAVFGIVSLGFDWGMGLFAFPGTILGIVALIKAKNKPERYGGRGLAIGGIVTSGIGWLIVPVVVPAAVWRDPVASNEAQVIGDIRSVISAEQSYASSNGGYYDTIECLVAPTDCIPGYPEDAPTFLGQDVAFKIRSEYVRIFYPGSAAPSEEGTSPSSIMSFALVAVPMQPGKSGKRAFCGSHDGRICATTDGTMAEIVDGRCPETCPPLN
jgi:hypothetical protein